MEYIAYKVRWVLLASVAMLALSRLYMSISFAVTNEIVADYLQVTPYQVDVLAVGDMGTAVFICFVMAIVGKSVGIRIQTIVCSICLLIGATLTAISFTRRNLYWCLALGRFVAGISTGFLYVLPAMVANIWFPPEEIATAFSVQITGFSVGSLVSTVIFSNLLPQTPKSAARGANPENRLEEFIDPYRVRVVYIFNMGVIAVLLSITFIILFKYAKDRPPTPASGAEERILDEHATASKSEATRKLPFCSGFYPALQLLKNRQFLLVTAANALSCSGLVLAVMLSTSMIHATFPMVDNRTSGIVLILVNISAGLGGVVAGKALDKFGKYKIFAAAGTFATALVSFCLFLGHHFQSLAMLFVFYPLLIFFRTFTVTTDVEFLVESTYPTEKITLTSLHFAFYNLGFFALGSLERLVMNEWGAVHAPLVSVFCNLLALVCLLLTPADYKRSAANEGKEEKREIDERDLLISG